MSMEISIVKAGGITTKDFEESVAKINAESNLDYYFKADDSPDSANREYILYFLKEIKVPFFIEELDYEQEDFEDYEDDFRVVYNKTTGIHTYTRANLYPLAEYFSCKLAKELGAKVFYEEGNEIILEKVLTEENYKNILAELKSLL